MALVAVAQTKFVRGVLDEDWRTSNTRGVSAMFDVSDLEDALGTQHRSDAHFVCYLVRDRGAPIAKQPRVNKSGLAFAQSLGFTVTCELLAADVDNPGHFAWSSDADARAEIERLSKLVPTAGFFATAHGLRVLQPLTRAIAVDQIEPVLVGWLGDLERRGVAVDWGCKDWTRLFRMPHVRRDGSAYRSPAVEIGAMRAVDPPASEAITPPKNKRARIPRVMGPAGPAIDAPLARAFEAAGMLGPTIATGRVAVQCPWEASHTIGARFDSSTVVFGANVAQPHGWFHCSHGHCMGRSQLEVIAALPQGHRAPIDATPPVNEPPSLEESTRALEQAIRSAPDGVTLVQTACGFGKSRAARAIAIERASKGTPLDMRAPLQSKTSISVPTHELAIEHANALRSAGASVRRIFGPLSVRRADGTPECRFAEVASSLAAGGQSVPWELCEGRGRRRCEHYDACDARSGTEGPDDARIIVGPHALVKRLGTDAGSTGLLVIDEPPALLASEVLTAGELEHAERMLVRFDRRYGAALAPALCAIRNWIATGPLDEAGSLDRALACGVDPDLERDAFDATGATSAIDAIRRAFAVDHKGSKAPPIVPREIELAKRIPARATELGRASRVLSIVHRALAPEDERVGVRIEERGERVLVVTGGVSAMIDALQREGATVVLDATLDVEAIGAVIGYDPPVHRFTAPDGAPIARTIIRVGSANRKGWLSSGRPIVHAVASQLRRAVDWVLEDASTREVGIITLKAIEPCFTAPEFVTELARLPVPPRVRHYGAIRGLDDWRDLDAVITLGDPWANVGDVRHDAGYLGVPVADRQEMLARAELEQAHGRLRTIHRVRPGRALHVGSVLPGGWPLLGVEVREPTGRPANTSAMSAEELSEIARVLGGMRRAAALWGTTHTTVGRYCSGARAIPVEFAALVTGDDATRGTETLTKI